MPLGPYSLAAEALWALPTAFAQAQPLPPTHTANPFCGLSSHTCSPPASRTDKERCEDKVALGRAELLTKQKGLSFTGTGSFGNRMGAHREGKIKYKHPLFWAVSLLKYHPSCFKNIEF